MIQMRVFLQKMSFNGIKNIKNTITIDFSNKTLNNELSDYTKVKAIYGPNGAGKTAVVDAFRFYQALTTEKTRLYNREFQDEIIETMNKLTSRIELSFTAIIIHEDDVPVKVKHDIELSLKDKEVIISNENLYVYKNVKSEVISKSIKQANGVVMFNKAGQEKVVGFEVTKRSIVEMYQAYLSMLFEKKTRWENLSKQDQIDFSFIFNFFWLSDALYIISENADEHSYYFINRKEEQQNQFNDSAQRVRHSIYDEIILASELEGYKTFYAKIEKFIKVFKTDLVSIDIEDKPVTQNEIRAEKYFNYGKYRVHMEFESAGIKKLVKLYAAIHNAINGRITVIDEFDANINDIYLNKLIEYVIYNAKGQLIFTTHNTSPMDTLRPHKRSIDFINELGEIVNWIINGNASPAKWYSNGAIEGLPFNINAFDFVGLFDEETT